MVSARDLRYAGTHPPPVAGRLDSGIGPHVKYIARFSDRTELMRVRQLLRSKGIPTHEQTLEGRRLGWYAALYVCMPEHVDDALRIIRNPSHLPTNPVDAEAFEKAMENPDTMLLARLVTFWGMIICILCAGISYVLWKYAT